MWLLEHLCLRDLCRHGLVKLEMTCVTILWRGCEWAEDSKVYLRVVGY